MIMFAQQMSSGYIAQNPDVFLQKNAYMPGVLHLLSMCFVAGKMWFFPC